MSRLRRSKFCPFQYSSSVSLSYHEHNLVSFKCPLTILPQDMSSVNTDSMAALPSPPKRPTDNFFTRTVRVGTP